VIRALQVRRAVDEEDRGYTERWIKKRSRGRTVVDVLFDEVAPRYANRPGGYTRLIRLSDRRIGDAGRQVLLQLVEESPGEGTGAAGGAGRRKKRAARRHEAAAGAGAQAVADARAGADESEVATEQPDSDAVQQTDTAEAETEQAESDATESDAPEASGGKDDKDSS
jgi:large subunit ribosomal protein L17